MTANPFKYGVVVLGEDFVDREHEIGVLTRHVLSNKSVMLYSPRQLGKSSLIAETFRRLGRRVLCVRVDLYGISSRERLAEEIIKGVVTSGFTAFDKMKKATADFLKSLKIDMVLTHEGDIRFEVAKGVPVESLGDAFDFAEKVAKRRGKSMVVAFDEFQEIGNLDGVELEKIMRSKFQYHRNVTYIFAGSKRSLLQEIFGEEGRAFYKFAEPMVLGPIPKEEFGAFISKKFRVTGGQIRGDVVERILDLTGGHPYYTQQLCYEIWFISKNANDAALVEEAVQNIITHQEINYLNIWENLPQLQRNLLIGLAREEELSIYSAEFIDVYRLKTQSHVKRAFELLEKKGIIDEGKVVDIFFREWLKKRKI